MSKGSFILEGSTGKVGSVVVRRRQGSTVLSEYVKPSNPQTDRQTAQRIIFATVQQAAKYMKPIIDHSFEGYAPGNKSVLRFSQLNLNRLRGYSVTDFEEATIAADSKCFMTTKNVSTVIPNKYIIATGSLNLDSRSAMSLSGGKLYFFDKTNSITCTATTTMREVLNSLFGLDKAGQQLTKCFIVGRDNTYLYSFNGDDAPGFQISDSGFKAMRLVVKDSADLTALATTTPTKASILALFDAQKSDDLLLSWLDEAIVVSTATVNLSQGESLDAFAPWGTFHVQCYGDILSEFYGSSWLRSNSEMYFVDVPTTEANYGLYWNSAVQAWKAGGANADALRFLNQGGNDNAVGF